jgi:hydroxyacylglutathione hydrolase
MEELNNSGALVFCRLSPLQPVPVPKMKDLIRNGCQILDIRAPTGFAAGHLPESISIWREGISAFAGWFLDYTRPIILVDDFNTGLEPVHRQLVRLGYDNITGFLAGGFPAWSKAAGETRSFSTCTARELHDRLEKENLFLLDVRDIRNRISVGHIRGAHHRYIGELPEHLDEVPKNEPVVVYCDAGYKGSLAAGILEKNQYRYITNLLGGMTAWKQAGYRIER